MYWIFDLCIGYLSYVWDICLIFWENQNHMSLGCNYGGVYCLVVHVGCRSCRRMQVLSKDAGLVEGCKACQRMQDLSKDAGLFKECFLETAGCGSVN